MVLTCDGTFNASEMGEVVVHVYAGLSVHGNLASFLMRISHLLLVIKLSVQWTGRDLNPRPFGCEPNITTPELPALHFV
jgi:hypothetical protein